MDLKELNRDESHNMLTGPNLERVQSRVEESADAVTKKPRETAEQYRHATALRMGSLATAAHHVAGDLEEQFPQAARYTHAAAAGFEHISNFLRDPKLDELGTLIRDLGRTTPAAVAAGVVLIGLGLSWFLKNTSEAAGTVPAGDGEGGTGGIH